MNLLIVESSTRQAAVWADHMAPFSHEITVARDRQSAVDQLRANRFDAIVLNLSLAEGTALMIADYAAYRQPWARMLFVTSGPGFSDGRLLQDYANARGVAQVDTPPADLAAMVDYYAKCA